MKTGKSSSFLIYCYTLKRKCMMSPSCTIYSLPSTPSLPASFTAASEWDKSCRKLSGGEKMRLAFCCLMISNNTPDMFILDEPTNNLDIQSIEIITATIKNYTGTVIAISHDDYFIQEIGIEQRILLS